MRDPELLITLLRSMSHNSSGRSGHHIVTGGGDEAMKKVHHMELLVDAGHAEWVTDGPTVYEIRITTAGYDFLNAIEKQPKVKDKFLNGFEAGLPYLQAVTNALEVVSRFGG